MSEAREAVLGRVRAALADRPSPPDVPYPVAGVGEGGAEDLGALFRARVEETGGVVVGTTDVRDAVGAALAARRASRVVVAADLAAGLRPADIEVVVDHDLPAGEIERVDAAVTTCAAACADTGTIALDGGPGQGRRVMSLLPDLHVCVVDRGQIVATVPELFARLEPSAHAGRPIVLVSGPSATSDIGFERVEGVHGPRQLVVVLTG